MERIQQAILALESQRQSLGDEIVETATASLRARLASLQASTLSEQRKLVTVLFADLVGSTALSSKMDAEDMRELLNAYFERCRRSIDQHGGVVEKFIGDAVMAVFGLTVSREDDPERAIHAGLEISHIWDEMQFIQAGVIGPALATRVGINTGEVVVGALGERQEGEFVVVGEAVNLASRLQNAAPAGGVLITHDTYRHVRGVFEVQPVEPLNLKGIADPVQAFLVKAAKPRAFRLARRGVEGVETHVVGREAELDLLKEAFVRVGQERNLQAMTVVGEAGIGKSRLMAEFEEWLELLPEKVYYFKGRAHPSTQTTPYSLVRDIFVFRFQIQDSDPPPTVRKKLEQGFALAYQPTRGREGRGESQQSEKAAHLFGQLLGFGLGPSEHLASAVQDARNLHDQAVAYLRDFFINLGNAHPVLILLEDLHWSDDSSLDLIHQLQSSMRKVPLLIVGAARPSLFERRPQWGMNLPSHERLDLGPLSSKDSLALVEQILQHVEDMPDSLINLVVATAEGNPFFIEELLKMLIEDGTIQTHEMPWKVEVDRLAKIHIPPTLTGVLQARIDGLSPEERSYLQRGSVIGRIFWDKAIEYLGEPGDGEEAGSAELPGKLRSREIIYERENSTFEDTREYLFKHALLRDITYESLLKRTRRIFHRQAARWLEKVTERSGRTDEFASLIAGHFEQAQDQESAADWYWRAGRGAAARYANAEALHTLSRALELTSQTDLERLYEIRLIREKVYELQGSSEERLRELDVLRSLAEKLGDPGRLATASLRKAAYAFSVSDFPVVIAEAQQAGELARLSQMEGIAAESGLLHAQALNRLGDMEGAWEHAQRSLDLARRHGLKRVEANCLRQLGLIAYYQGRHREALELFAGALAIYDEIGDSQGKGMAINNLGGVYFELGQHQQAREYYSRSLRLCREIGDRTGEGRALNNLGIIAVVQSDYELAEEYYLQSLQIGRETGQRSFEMASLDNLGNLSLYRYQYSRAKRYLEEALQGARQIGDRVSEGFSLINLARCSLMAGDYESASRMIQSGLKLIREIGDHQGECHQLVNLSYYHCEMGNYDSARIYARQALDQSRQHGFQSEEAWALHFLGEVELASGNALASLEHFQAALKLRQEMDEMGEACESKAGLASACLALGDVDQGSAHAEQLLTTWEANGYLGLDQPGLAVLRCYQVLAAAGNSRAADLLERGYRLLQECAANIEEEDLRRAFLENIRANRELLKIWEETN